MMVIIMNQLSKHMKKYLETRKDVLWRQKRQICMPYGFSPYGNEKVKDRKAS